MRGSEGKTALVLSAGMMFGAWQAGVWKALAASLRPGLIVGVSSGALNGWAIAGGCGPDELAAMWLDPGLAGITRVRVPFPPWSGVFDSRPLAELAERLHSTFHPKTDFGLLAAELPRLRACLFRNEQITSLHLLASCSVALGFRPVRIAGKLYVDGGLLDSLPIWAAAHMGAARVIAIHALPKLPSLAGRTVVRAVRLAAPPLPASPGGLRAAVITPSRSLGSLRDMIRWRHEKAEEWIELGRMDGQRFLKTCAAEFR